MSMQRVTATGIEIVIPITNGVRISLNTRTKATRMTRQTSQNSRCTLLIKA
jgi:hypothetical protein